MRFFKNPLSWRSRGDFQAAFEVMYPNGMLKSVDGLFLTDAAFMLRLHPKPADADKPIVQAASRTWLTRRGPLYQHGFWCKNDRVNC